MPGRSRDRIAHRLNTFSGASGLASYLSYIRTPAHLRPVVKTEGWLAPLEAQILYELARDCSDGCIIEVGSYRGRSTVALALGARAGSNAPIYAFDPHESFVGLRGAQFGPDDRAAFYRTMLKSGAYRAVRLVNLPSAAVSAGWQTPVGLLWLDGDHSYEGVKSDLAAWRPHLSPSSTIAFHDSTDPNLGPLRVIRELTASGEFRVVTTGELSVLRRTSPLCLAASAG